MFTAAMLTSAILTMAIRVYLELSERCSVAVDEDLLPQALLSDGALQRPGALQSERLARYRRRARRDRRVRRARRGGSTVPRC